MGIIMSNSFKNILILSDIDGTFLGKRSRIIERNIKAVERFKAGGGLFTFSTGRTQANIYFAVPTAGELANAPASLSNGCCLYDLAERRPIEEYLLKAEPALSAAKYIRRNMPDVGLRISEGNRFIVDPSDAVAVANIERMSGVERLLSPVEDWEPGWYKAVVIGKEERLTEVRNELYSVFGDAFCYNRSGRNLIEIHRPERSKAATLDTYRRLFSKKGGELKIYAVGDYYNDYEMLCAADVAVCPSNAVDKIKDIADYCLGSNEEGVVADLVELLESEGDI